MKTPSRIAQTPVSARRRPTSRKKPLRVALCVFPITADPWSNLESIARLARAAALKGARMAVFAEGALSGYFGEHFFDEKEIDRQGIDAVNRAAARVARDTGLYLVAGTLLCEGRRYFNSALAFSPSGRRLARYDKRHLTRRDHRFYTPGRRPALFRADGWTVGMLICFDARFPLWSHEYARRGTDILTYSLNMCGRRDLWKRPVMEAAVRTRAGENNVFVLAVNDGRPHPQMATLALDRGGRTLARALPTRPTVLVADLDPAVKYPIETDILSEHPRDYPLAARWAARALPRHFPGGGRRGAAGK